MTLTDQTQSQPYSRLSTHILLGDHLRERNPRYWLSDDGSCGCALGGAMLSVGLRGSSIGNRGFSIGNENRACILERWPWLAKSAPYNPERVIYGLFPDYIAQGWLGNREHETKELLACGSYGPITGGDNPYMKPPKYAFIWAISDLFIRVYHGSLTIEQLADQVREWEEIYDDQLRASLSLSLSSFDSADDLREGAKDLVPEAEVDAALSDR